ncbi:MAG TPA: FliH/SctL family protein [Lacipirellulaceae bacterium]
MASIIRRHGPSQPSSTHAPRPVAFNFEDMNDRANEYLETVRTEAAKIVQQAHQQAEQLRRQAQVTGREAAEEAAQKALDDRVAKRMDTIFPALEQLVTELNDAKAELMRRWEESAVAVAVSIAQRIIRRELEQKPEITLDLIGEALRLAAGAADITVHVNQTDYEHLGAQINRLAYTLSRLTPTKIHADPEITPGGCVVKTKYGEIDQQIESQLARIRDELS